MILKALKSILRINTLAIFLVADIYITYSCAMPEKQVVYLLGYILCVSMNFILTLGALIPLLTFIYNHFISKFTNCSIEYEDAVIIFFIMQILTFITAYSNEF